LHKLARELGLPKLTFQVIRRWGWLVSERTGLGEERESSRLGSKELFTDPENH
jgi:hypothetical protein